MTWIRSSGEGLIAPPPTPGVTFGQARQAGHFDILLHVLLVLVVVILASRALGALFRYFHQPPVIGEVIAGIMLGPSLLGRIAPGASAYLLPPEIGPYLSVLAQVGARLIEHDLRPVLPHVLERAVHVR